MRRREEKFTIIVDSNELSRGKAWSFPFNRTSRKSLLHFGCDYSVRGLVGKVGVERKSYGDYVRCCGKDWKRFKKQLAKLQCNTFHCVVVEGGIGDPIYRGSLMTDDSVIIKTARITALGIPVVFAGSRTKAAAMCVQFMRAVIRKIREGTTREENEIQQQSAKRLPFLS